MTLKRFLIILLVAALAALLWPQIALALGIQDEPPPPPELPMQFVAGLTILAGYLVNKGIELLLAHFGIDLSGRLETLTQALATALIAFFSGLLGVVPLAFQGLAIQVLIMIGLALAGLGIRMLILDNNAAKMGFSSGRAFLNPKQAARYSVFAKTE